MCEDPTGKGPTSGIRAFGLDIIQGTCSGCFDSYYRLDFGLFSVSVLYLTVSLRFCRLFVAFGLKNNPRTRRTFIFFY